MVASRIDVTVAVLLFLLSLAHAHLLGTVLLGFGSEPPLLLLGHGGALVLAAAAAYASWTGRSWAWKAVLGYGALLALLVLMLAPLLDLPSDAWFGLGLAGIAVLSVTGLLAYALRRSSTRQA